MPRARIPARPAALALLVLVTAAIFAPVVGHELTLVDWSPLMRVMPGLGAPNLAFALRVCRHIADPLDPPAAHGVHAVMLGLAPCFGADFSEVTSPVVAALLHAPNVLTHVLSALVVFALIRRLVARSWAAFAGALLFAVHPLQVEPVASVAALPVALGGLFGLLALWQYVAYAQASAPWPARVHDALALVCLALALLSSPVALAVPLMALALDVGLMRHDWRRALISTAPWLAVSLGVAIWALRTHDVSGALAGAPPWTWPLILTDALSFTLLRLAFPVRLAADYAWTPAATVGRGVLWFSWLAPTALAVAIAWVARKGVRWPGACAAIFLAGLLPALIGAMLLPQRISPLADRYAYAAMLGPALAVAYLVGGLRRRRAQMALAAVLAGLVALSVVQVGYWRDDRSLYARVLAVSPESFVGHRGMALVLQMDGDWTGALPHLRAVAELRPDPDTTLDIATALTMLERNDEALEVCRSAAERWPDSFEAHARLGEALAAAGRSQEGIAELRQAVALAPSQTSVRWQLARALAAAGQLAEAVEQMRLVVAETRSPELERARYELAVLLARTDRRREAVDELALALARREDFPEAQALLHDLLRQLEERSARQWPDTGP